jgi:hypothetical protein
MQAGTATGTIVHCWTATAAGRSGDAAVERDRDLLGHAHGHLARGGLGDHPAGGHRLVLDLLLGDHLQVVTGHVLDRSSATIWQVRTS